MAGEALSWAKRRMWRLGWGALGLTLLMTTARAQHATVERPRLTVRPASPGERGIRLTASPAQADTVLRLERSEDLARWAEVATFHDAVWDYPEVDRGNGAGRFYRLSAAGRGGEDDWKNQVEFPAESFRSTYNVNEIGWVKFAILLDDPDRVYFQDTRAYAFHYDFARRRLKLCQGMDAATFDRIALRRAGQQVVLGTVFYPPGWRTDADWLGSMDSCGIQFDGLDPYTCEEVAGWFERVKASIHATQAVSFQYVPTFEQAQVAVSQVEAFAARGIAIGSSEIWSGANSCYAPGWALGRLRFFPAAEIAAAYGDGRLRPDDILLSDGVPADTPIVAGIATLTPATPNSHTALLSLSFDTPFGYLAEAQARERARALDGRRVVLRVSPKQGDGQVTIIDAEGLFTAAFEAELLARKQPKPLQFPARKTYGAIWARTDRLTPADSPYFGGKAANYGVLRRSIPTNCPEAIAFSFDLWEAFLDQPLAGESSLRAAIAARLAPYTGAPAEIPALKATLAQIRQLFTQSAAFTPARKTEIMTALAGFDPRRKLRFRSSTNVEDAEQFTGAGLYDSYSGCLADDQDGDDQGPCACDPAETGERGVFRALQKVYASFYNDDAYLGRLRHRVDETRVAMGVLVHPSFPDEQELANGVATPRFQFRGWDVTAVGDLVTQKGAESVTNPSGAAQPEVVRLEGSGGGYGFTLTQGSSLVPLGATVLAWQDEYRALGRLIDTVARQFHQHFSAESALTLDFEYKKDAHQGLVIKQVRQLPQSDAATPVTAFLLDQPLVCEVAQYGSVFANHRLKSFWTFHAPNMLLTESNLVQGVYADSTLEYCDGTRRLLSGPMGAWPNATVSGAGATNSWSTGEGAQRWDWRLETAFKTTVTGAQPPIFILSDFSREVTVNYATPVPRVQGTNLVTVTNETVWLQPRKSDLTFALRQQRLFTNAHGLRIETAYYWPKPPQGAVAIMSPLQCFVASRIEGLTSQPLVLTGDYSQTYGAYAHNAWEEFLFEPGLEPDLPEATRAELEAANVKLLFISSWATSSGRIYAIGFDGALRAL